jgi:hypothetical protein
MLRKEPLQTILILIEFRLCKREKAELFLYLINYHTIRTYWGVDV